MGHIFTIYRQIYQFYRHFCKIKNSAVYNRICMVFATQTLRSILKSLTGSVFLFFALGIYRPCWKYCLYKTSKKCIFCVRYRWAVPEIYKTWEKSVCQSIKQSFHYIDAKLCANLTINGGCFLIRRAVKVDFEKNVFLNCQLW